MADKKYISLFAGARALDKAIQRDIEKQREIEMMENRIMIDLVQLSSILVGEGTENYSHQSKAINKILSIIAWMEISFMFGLASGFLGIPQDISIIVSCFTMFHMGRLSRAIYTAWEGIKKPVKMLIATIWGSNERNPLLLANKENPPERDERLEGRRLIDFCMVKQLNTFWV